jgi:hypothetical protein
MNHPLKPRLAIAPLLLGLTLAGPAHAGDANNHYNMMGYGTKPCSAYTAARQPPKESEEIIYSSWLTGFLSAINVDWPDTYSISGKTNLSDMLQWLDRYCGANPKQQFEQAAMSLVVYLGPNRVQQKAK